MTNPLAEENQEAVEVTVNDDVIIVKGDIDALNEYPSSNPAQGTHKWVGIDINTGTNDITKVKYNGEYLTNADVAEAASIGLGAGHVVLWFKADEETKTFTLQADGAEEATITVRTEDV